MYTLDDLRGLEDHELIFRKVKRSKVFCRILCWININTKKGSSPGFQNCECARALRLTPEQTHQNLRLMESYGILRRIVRDRKIVIYLPVSNDGNPVYKKYLKEAEITLGLSR